ncbi:hypothetical protein CON64_11810 [Bacillus pseudomycoides]|nr:hypothetical protein CON64_11810 [Bacillus pseudomycoides]
MIKIKNVYKYIFIVTTSILNIISCSLIANTLFLSQMLFSTIFVLFTILFQSTTILFIIYMIRNDKSKKIKVILYIFLILDIFIFLSLLFIAYTLVTLIKYH